jgi:hypothetical protein
MHLEEVRDEGVGGKTSDEIVHCQFVTRLEYKMGGIEKGHEGDYQRVQAWEIKGREVGIDKKAYNIGQQPWSGQMFHGSASQGSHWCYFSEKEGEGSKF